MGPHENRCAPDMKTPLTFFLLEKNIQYQPVKPKAGIDEEKRKKSVILKKINFLTIKKSNCLNFKPCIPISR